MKTNQRFLVNKRGILALLAVLALMALLATQVVWAQEEEDEPCTEDGGVIRCAYAEIDKEPVVRIYATSPERDEVEFSLEGIDAPDFTIDGGVLRFKKSPSFEQPSDRVRAEVVAVEDDPNTDADETVKAVPAEEAGRQRVPRNGEVQRREARRREGRDSDEHGGRHRERQQCGRGWDGGHQLAAA